MNYYHVAYFIEGKESPTLSGMTIQASSISDAEAKFHEESDFQVHPDRIKYIIKLN